MPVGRFVKGRGNHLGVDTAGHVSDLLRPLIYEQDYHIYFGMVGGNGIGNLLEKHGLPRLGLRHDEPALPLADRGKHVDNTGRDVVVPVAGELEFLIGEKGREMLKGNPVTDIFG